MKTTYYLLCFLLVGLSLKAQNPATVQISEQIESMRAGAHNAFVFTVPGTSKSNIEKKWKKFIKGYKAKVSYHKASEEIFADNATIEEMSENTVDVYAKVYVKDKNEIKMVVWYNLGATWLSANDHPNAVPHATMMIQEFYNSCLKDGLAEELKQAEKVLQLSKKELKKMERDQKKQRQVIEKKEDEIARIKRELEEEEQKLAEQKEEAQKQEAVIGQNEQNISDIRQKIRIVKNRK